MPDPLALRWTYCPYLGCAEATTPFYGLDTLACHLWDAHGWAVRDANDFPDETQLWFKGNPLSHVVRWERPLEDVGATGTVYR